jgi:hypothetical protein
MGTIIGVNVILLVTAHAVMPRNGEACLQIAVGAVDGWDEHTGVFTCPGRY